jgi:hypothetical protein
MNRIPFLLLIALLFGGFTNYSFSQKGNYEQVAEFQPPHIDFSRNSSDRKYQLNALKLSDSGNLLLADYGNKNSLIAVYNLDSLKLIGAYWIDNIIELDHCYFSDNDTRLYVKASRFSSDYKVINLENKTVRDVSCDKTPRGCVATTASLSVVKFYSPDRKYYFVRNTNDKRTLHIYKRVGE